MLVYNYLMLDKDDITNVCGVISRKDVIKEIGEKELKYHLEYAYKRPFRDKYILVEDEVKPVTKKVKKPADVLLYEGARGNYYATYDGEFYIIYHKSGKKHYLSKYMNNYKGYLAVSMKRNSYCAKNLIAMIFLEGYQKGDIVCCKNNDPTDVRADNLKIIPKRIYAKSTYGLISAKKVGLYDENGKLVRTWASARRCAKDMYCSYQMITDICNNKWQRKEYDVRWI